MNNENKIIQISSCSNYSLALDNKGQVYAWGFLLGGNENIEDLKISLIPKKVYIKEKIVKLFSGNETIFALSKNDKVYAWGLNNQYQAGFENKESYSLPLLVNSLCNKKIKQISCGFFHTLILLKDNSVYSLGDNKYGQLGIGNRQESKIPVKVNIDNIIQISCGSYHSLALDKFGNAYTWGFGEMYQLGNGEDKDELFPILLTGQQLEKRKIKKVCGGSQHTLILSK